MNESFITSRAPVRIDAGGPTDVPALLENGTLEGFIFNTAIAPGTFVHIEPRNDASIVIHAEDYKKTEEFSGIEQLKKTEIDLLKAAIIHVNPNRGFILRARTGLPPGSGLGASASLAVTSLSGLHALKEGNLYRPDPEKLAQEAIYLETEYLNNTGGSQDQYAASYGGFNTFSYTKDGFRKDPLSVSDSTQDTLYRRMIVVYSGVSHFSGKILDQIIQSHREGDVRMEENLFTIRDLAKQIAQALAKGEVDKLGELLTQIWRAQSSLHDGISTREIENILETALKLGAYGGKALGAAGGGCVVIVCPEERKEIIEQALGQQQYRMLPFRFSSQGVINGYE